MAKTVTYIRTVAKSKTTPQEILTIVNGELCLNNEECLFVTLFCGILDLITGELNYASGGHDAPLVIRDKKVHFLPLETGAPLGIDDEAFFPTHQYLLQPQDLLVLYTDGITEAMNHKGEFFTIDRLMEILDNHDFYNPLRIRGKNLAMES